MIVPYWQFTYRKNMSDPGRIYLTTKYDLVPDVVKAYAVKEFIEIADELYMRKDFDLIEYIKHTRFRRHDLSARP